MLAEFKRTEGVDLSQDKMALQRIKEAAEKAKKNFLLLYNNQHQPAIHHSYSRISETLRYEPDKSKIR